jgi:transposase
MPIRLTQAPSTDRGKSLSSPSNNPLQLGFEFALWTRAMIREVIREQSGVRLSDVSVGRLLRKLRLSPQRPLRKAY